MFMPYLYGLVFMLLGVQAAGCSNHKEPAVQQVQTAKVDTVKPSVSEIETMLIRAGLVNVQEVEPRIRVNLKYSTTDNFMHADLYGDLENAYLQLDVAAKMKKAYDLLQQKDPQLTFLIYDAVRPRSIQQKMWDSLKMPVAEKTKFISNPKNGSLHNYAAAVDITLCDKQGIALDMGTPYDFIGERAYPRLESIFLAQGKLTAEQIANRKLLRTIMQQAGFRMIQTEWWHFNSCSREEAKIKYPIIE